ncbi:MAG: hypothetical protein IKJ45_00645 [Kiritimatiellae bacterium]|nr:hypothetical protein [Kiritimatiellia bacterium]
MLGHNFESVTGMPKFQLLHDFWNLEGPYETVKLDKDGEAERVGWFSALSDVATFDEYKQNVEDFRRTARVREVRRYKCGIEIVKYDVWFEGYDNKLYGPHLLDVKYGPGGVFLSYTFDPEERTPFYAEAFICKDKIKVNREEHIIDWCMRLKFNEGLFLYEKDWERADIQVWNLCEKGSIEYSLEWMWGTESLRRGCIVTSVDAMLGCVHRYIKGGLGEAQRGLKWESVYAVALHKDYAR